MITSSTSARPKLGDKRIGAFAALVVMLHAAAGAAQSPAAGPVRAHLSVDAESACEASTLAARVRERSQRIELVDDAGDMPRLHVSIGGAGARDRVAVLAVRWPDGQRSERRITARSCEAAIDALGLLIAMTLDPSAPVEAEKTEEKTAVPEPAPDARADVKGAVDTAASADAEPHADEERIEDRAASARSPLGVEHFAAGLSAHVLHGLAPRAMPGLGLYARLGLNGTALWTPAIELRLARTWLDGLAEPGGRADFALESAQLDVCPLGVRLAVLSAFACLSGEVGRLTASGSESYSPQTRHLLWTSLGGTLLLSLGLGSIAELHGGLGVSAPARRDRFSFRPDVFHEVETLSISAHLGAGVRFP